MWVYNGRHSKRRSTTGPQGPHGGPKRSSKVRNLFHRQNGKCALCGRLMTYDINLPNTATVDHKVPRSLGGSSKMKNLQAACAECNNAKGSTVDEATQMLLKTPPPQR